jgi:hypothetical protein
MIGLAMFGLALFAAALGSARAEDQPPLHERLAGNTLSAVLFVPRPAAGSGSLNRVVFQAYLRADGSALVRVWDPARDAYTAPSERKWSATGMTLCLDIPRSDIAGQGCAELHYWGPRIAGTGTGQFFMLDGDIEAGNTIVATK